MIIEQWQAAIADAKNSGSPLCLRGGGSKDFYGQAPVGDVLDTKAYNGVVEYEPTELVITVRCGTPLAELETTLAEQGQMLAFEPPHFGAATVGGAVAAGLAGPRRARVGGVRDFVLGAQLLDGRGRLMNFGGQVMKNVAGYDVSRLLAGSFGTLGIITEVSLKVLPLPAREQTLCLDINEAEALATLSDWAARPLPISATAWSHGQLHVRLSGAEPAVAAAATALGGERLDEVPAGQFWRDIREHQHPFFAGAAPLWRVALPANAKPLNLGDSLLEWNGTQRWLRGAQDAVALRQQVADLGGHATLFRGGDKSVGVFTPLSSPLHKIQQNLKSLFDPDRIFNSGRLYPDL